MLNSRDRGRERAKAMEEARQGCRITTRQAWKQVAVIGRGVQRQVWMCVLGVRQVGCVIYTRPLGMQPGGEWGVGSRARQGPLLAVGLGGGWPEGDAWQPANGRAAKVMDGCVIAVCSTTGPEEGGRYGDGTTTTTATTTTTTTTTTPTRRQRDSRPGRVEWRECRGVARASAHVRDRRWLATWDVGRGRDSSSWPSHRPNHGGWPCCHAMPGHSASAPHQPAH